MAEGLHQDPVSEINCRWVVWFAFVPQQEM